MAHHLEVIAPEDLVQPAVGIFTVGFFELGGVVLGGLEGAFAFPVEHGVAFDGLEAEFFEGDYCLVVFEGEFGHITGVFQE